MKTFFTSIAIAFSAMTIHAQTACSVQVVGVQGVECPLLYDFQQNVTIMPCTWPANLPRFQVGDSLIISYTPGNCVAFCMQGQYSDITCGTYSNRPSGIENGTNTKTLSVYPQPATQVVEFSQSDKVKKVSIYNSLGQLIEVRSDVVGNSLDVNMLGTGIYMFHFEGEGISELQKVSILK